MFIASGAILFGSYLAMKQDSLKRILAYSSIAQIGYMVLGIALITELGLMASLVHIFNHAFIKTGLFLAVTAIIYFYDTDSLEKLMGIAKQTPFIFALFIISGLSLIGAPLTSGFISKWYLIKASIEADYWIFVSIIVISSVMAIIYIGRIIETTYFKPADKQTAIFDADKRRPYLLFLSLVVISFINIYFGVETSLNVNTASQIANELINK